jgi:hypothetical protein
MLFIFVSIYTKQRNILVQLRLFEFVEKLHVRKMEFSKNLFITQASSSQLIKVVSIPLFGLLILINSYEETGRLLNS